MLQCAMKGREISTFKIFDTLFSSVHVLVLCIPSDIHIFKIMLCSFSLNIYYTSILDVFQAFNKYLAT